MLKLNALASALLLVLVGCNSGNDKEPDAGPAGDQNVTVDQQPAGPDVRPAGIYRVAAVQYSSGKYGAVDPSCTDDVCGLTKLMEQAAAQGAQLVVTPEYATDQEYSEPAPKVGDAPATDSRWDDTFLQKYAKVADRLDIIAVVNLITEDNAGKLYNTNMALDADGKVVARHFKLELFSGEASQLTPGQDVTASFFDTPVGKAGLMICADAQCIVAGLNSSWPDCSAHAAGLLTAYFQQKPKLIAFSAFWTVGGTGIWAALNVQKKIATDGQVWLVGANNIVGQGLGGGIWKPDGEALSAVQESSPKVVMGDIPLP